VTTSKRYSPEVRERAVRLVRGSLRYVSWKERRAVAKDLRTIYQGPTVEVVEQALEAFEERWLERFPMVTRK
jgi:putative transposase